MELLGTTKIVERVDAAVEELDPKTHHAIGAAELVADGGSREARNSERIAARWM